MLCHPFRLVCAGVCSFALSVSLSSCGLVASVFNLEPRVATMEIQDLTASLPKDVEKASAAKEMITLRGQVRQVAPLLTGVVYQLQDPSGKIWVRSSYTDLRAGDTVIVKGIPRRQTMQVGSQKIAETYVEEQNRLYRKPQAN